MVFCATGTAHLTVDVQVVLVLFRYFLTLPLVGMPRPGKVRSERTARDYCNRLVRLLHLETSTNILRDIALEQTALHVIRNHLMTRMNLASRFIED